jgi:hypothetical protein
MKRLVLALLCFFTLQAPLQAQTIGPGQIWKNQYGSVLAISSVSPGGSFRGIFTNHADGFSCQGIPYPVTGQNVSVQITFTVNFVKCKTITVWKGDVAGLGMSTPWLLRYIDQNGTPQTMTGFDFFGRFQ